MKILIYDVKEKWDKKYIYFIYLLQLVVLAAYLLSKSSSDDFLQSFQYVQKSALIVFVSIFFLSYEIFCEFQKTEWKEVIILQKHGWLKVLAAKNLNVFFLIIVDFALASFIEFSTLMSAGSAHLLLENVFHVLILNFVLFPVMGMVMGKTFALVLKKRWSGYLCILIMILLGCGLFYRINMGLYLTTGINLDEIFRLFQFEQPNDSWVADYLYLVPAETYRFCLFGAWIAGCEALICIVYFKVKGIRVVLTSICSVLCVLFVWHVVNAQNYVNYDLNYGTAVNKNTEFENDKLPAETKADFTVKECHMNLHVSDELEADVVLILGGEDVSAYNFTLYRGYELTNVTDEDGNDLTYDREYDYITIHTSDDISEIHMSYYGYQQSFYSNSHGVMLPGYFAYYPQPGFRQVFLYQVVDHYQYYGFNVQEDSLQEVYYEIQTDYNGEVFSNLNKEGSLFIGKTIAPTLMGGAASENCREDGHYVYPTLIDISDVSLNSIKASLEKYCNILNIDAERFKQLDQVIVVPSSVYIGNTWGENVIVDDCLFVGTSWVSSTDSDEFAREILKQYMNVQGDKSLIQDILFAVLQNSMYLQDLEPISEQEFLSISYDETDPESEEYADLMMNFTIDRMYLMLLEKYDENEVLQKTAQYLIDADASENSAEFMQNLYFELEEK